MLKALETKIQASYEEGVSLEEAEKLAAEFLHAQIKISSKLKVVSLDAKMRKSGLKALRAALYLDAASKGDKKPTEATLSAIIDSNELVQKAQNELDTAETDAEELGRYYDVFTQAHVYYRQVSKGSLG